MVGKTLSTSGFKLYFPLLTSLPKFIKIGLKLAKLAMEVVLARVVTNSEFERCSTSYGATKRSH